MNVSDATLWQRWQRERDPDAFAEIVARHSGMVYAACRRILRSAVDAEDAAQECFLELLNGRVKVETSLAPWLHTVAVRRALNRVKADVRRRERERRFSAAETDVAKETTSEIVLDDLMNEIDAGIVALPEELRAPVICRFLEGQCYEAIAERLGVPESTVRHRTNKGVERIRMFLRSRGIPVGAAALVAALSTTMTEAASASLTMTLGKLAIGGPSAAVVTQAGGSTLATAVHGTIWGAIAMKKAVAGVIIVAAVVAGIWFYAHPSKKAGPLVAPVIPKEIKAKLEKITPPIGQTTQDIRPVLLPNTATPTPAEPSAAASAVSKETGTAKPASISGHVTDRDGNPIAGAEVDLTVGKRTAIIDNVSYFDVEGEYSTTTAGDGVYVIDGITAFGAVDLTAIAKGHVIVQNGWGRHVPGSPDLTEIEKGGTYEGVDFKLMPAVSRLAGRVIDQANAPIAGARIVLSKQLGEKQSQGWHFTRSDEAGRFELPLPCEGACVLVVRKKGYGAGHFPDIQSGTDDLELMLSGGGSIAGRATTRDDKPLAGRQVIIMAEDEPGDVGNPWMATGWATLVTDDDGQYRLDDVSPSFTYTVRLPFPAPEKETRQETMHTLSEALKQAECTARAMDEIRYGSIPKTVLDEKRKVEVRAGEVTRVDLVAENEALTPAVVYGRVTDPATGAPVCPLFVSVCSADYDPPILSMAVTRPDGTYRMEILGMYVETEATIKAGHCYAPEPVGSGLYKNVEAQPVVTTIPLGSGMKQEVNFAMPASVTAPVRCVSTTGEPVQDVEVHWIHPDEEGRLVLYGLAPYMTHQLTAFSESSDRGYIPRGSSAPFTGKPGETLPEIEIVCNYDTGSLVGQVVLPEGMEECPFSRVNCRIFYPDLPSVYQCPEISPDGVITIHEMAPGTCSILMIVATTKPEEKWWALLENVQITAGQTTNVGDIVPNPPVAEGGEQ